MRQRRGLHRCCGVCLVTAREQARARDTHTHTHATGIRCNPLGRALFHATLACNTSHHITPRNKHPVHALTDTARRTGGRFPTRARRWRTTWARRARRRSAPSRTGPRFSKAATAGAPLACRSGTAGRWRMRCWTGPCRARCTNAGSSTGGSTARLWRGSTRSKRTPTETASSTRSRSPSPASTTARTCCAGRCTTRCWG